VCDSSSKTGGRGLHIRLFVQQFKPTPNFITATEALQDTSSYIIRATCGWKACGMCPEAVPTLCSKSRISQCYWVCEGQIWDTEAHSFSCIDTTKKKKRREREKRFIITNNQPQARVSVCGMSVECSWLYCNCCVQLLAHATAPWLLIVCCNDVLCVFVCVCVCVCVSVLALPVDGLMENQFVTFHSCAVHLITIKVFFIFTNGCTIYLLRSTLKFTLKLLLHVSV
jgi:hypothetical protein